MASSKPFVVTRAVRAPLCSRSVLVPTVVPWRRTSSPSWATLRRASTMAWEGSAGVEKTLSMRRRPASIQTQSVKVPPVSMAMRSGWGRRGMEWVRRIRVTFAGMRYAFLVETYATERVKVVSVWSEFRDQDLAVRPRGGDPRGRSVREQMVHQCVSEDLWFRNMLGIDVGAPPLPSSERRLEFMKRYAEDSGARLAALQLKDEAWWEAEVNFFEVLRSRAWVMVRRMTHTSHQR